MDKIASMAMTTRAFSRVANRIVVGIDVRPVDSVLSDVIIKIVSESKCVDLYKSMGSDCTIPIDKYEDVSSSVVVATTTRNHTHIDINEINDQITKMHNIAVTEFKEAGCLNLDSIRVSEFFNNLIEKGYETWDLTNLLARILVDNENNCCNKMICDMYYADISSPLVKAVINIIATKFYSPGYIDPNMIYELNHHIYSFDVDLVNGCITTAMNRVRRISLNELVSQS